MDDARCFPANFNFALEEQEFIRLLVIPYLDKKTIYDISRLDAIGIGDERINQFLSCMWKNKELQRTNGSINFEAIERDLTAALGREVGDTGPGINLSKIEANRMVNDCRNLGGYSHGVKVVLVRNCILKEIKYFVNQQ